MAFDADTEWLAWAAGVLDGEGCIYLVRGGHLNITVGNTNLDMVERLFKIFGYGRPKLLRAPSRRRYRPFWVWHVSSKQAAEVLEAVLPYLVAKKEQARLALLSRQYLNSPGDWKKNESGEQLRWFKAQISELNQGGS